MVKTPRVSGEYISTALPDSIRIQISSTMATIALAGHTYPTVVLSFVLYTPGFVFYLVEQLGRNVQIGPRFLLARGN